ncbi:VanZ family protein [Rossellomorea sp. SC111]|uniref:VanZ family protein n=1 Tax=Rossellomorea sp. SC111 TaxID=2968985 RepID=UPI00215A70B4|nr:VanZ family protein [Rossellomorea sp. SC111]MCR8850403.1 VanZ family protein [Rossellomorea sp. SC111]
MKTAAVVTYMGLLFCLTCTENIHNLLHYYDLRFQWTGQPDVKPFFNFSDYPFSSPGYLQQKAGHAFCFFWLATFFHWIFKRLTTVFLFSVAYASFTEIAQLYFSRTGCLLDVCYDSVGILLFIFIGKSLHYMDRSKSKWQSNSTHH